MSTEHRPDDLLHEEQVYEKYKHLLADRELREARQRGEIEWYSLRKGPHYTIQQVMKYLDRHKRQACESGKLDPAREAPNVSLKSEASGSGEKKASKLSIVTGMNPKLEERAASLLERET